MNVRARRRLALRGAVVAALVGSVLGPTAATAADTFTYAGTVLDHDGNPLEDVSIYLLDDAGVDIGDDAPEAITTSDGAFEISGLEVGTYEVIVGPPDYDHVYADFYVVLVGDVENDEIQLEPGGTVVGQVQGDGDADCAQDGSVELYEAASTSTPIGQTGIDSMDCTFAFTNLPLGEYRAKIVSPHQDYMTEWAGMRPTPADSVPIVLTTHGDVFDASTELSVYPRFISEPTVGGNAWIGATLNATPGSWVGPSYMSVGGQWYSTMGAIPGATGTTFKLTAQQYGDLIWYADVATVPGLAPLQRTSVMTMPVQSLAPDWRKNLRVLPTGGTTFLDLVWSKSDIAVGYRIDYRSPRHSGSVEVGDVTRFKLARLKPGTRYTVKVTIIDRVRSVMSDSASVSATTAALPATPTKLKSTKKSKSSVTLKWNKSARAVKYVVRYKHRGKLVSKVVNTSSKSTLSYKVTGLSKKTTYYFTVVAVAWDGPTSGASKVIKVKTKKK